LRKGRGIFVLSIIAAAFLIVGCGDAPTGGGKAASVKPKTLEADKVAREMVTVPAGEFLYGSNKDEEKVTLKAFTIDKYEVTNRQFKVFVKATKRKEPRGWFIYGYKKAEADHPMTLISYNDAADYCEWARLRLPSEQEWERAARGTDGRRYPWGNEWASNKANTSLSGIVGTSPVGSYPDGKSPVGAFDMAGNLWEWTSSDFDDDQVDTTVKAKVVRGGSWGLTHRFASTYFRVGYNPTTVINNIGFRCAKGPADSKGPAQHSLREGKIQQESK